MSDLMVKFLTRPGCHLCDDARAIVEDAAEKESAVVQEIDVDAFPELKSKYGNRVPVVLGPDGRVIAEGVIDDRRRLRKRIKRSARAAG